MTQNNHSQPAPQKLGDFTEQADAYQASRPNYPVALIEELIHQLNLQPSANVADIGAGTGIFTAQLAAHGFNMTAVEPNPVMSNKAVTHTNVRWVKGTFEETYLPDASQDWITAAQAFHWAKPDQALPELHRILKPNSAFTALWNNRLNNEEPILTRTWELIRTNVPEFDDTYRDNGNWENVLTSNGLFHDVTRNEHRHIINMPRERYLALWHSHNHLNVSAGPQRFAKLIQLIEQDLDKHNVDVVPMPYLCQAWTAKRRDT